MSHAKGRRPGWQARRIAAEAPMPGTVDRRDVLRGVVGSVAAVSLGAWIMVIVMGRFIMYNDTLLYALGL